MDRGYRSRDNETSGPNANNELFVRNLSWKVTEDDLRSFFGKYGELTRVNLLSERDGRSKGIGFVGFATKDDAEEALKKANGEEFEGRNISLSWAAEKKERTRSRSPVSNKSKFTAHIGNISFKTRESDLKEFFEDCGAIVEVRVAKAQDGKSKGFAHVDFEDQAGLDNGLNKNGNELDGRELRVSVSKPYVPSDKFDGGSRSRGGFRDRGRDRGGFRGRGDRGDRDRRGGGRYNDDRKRRRYSDDD